MNRNAKIDCLWLVILVLLVTACVNNDFDDLPKPPAGTAVSFRTETIDEFATRSAGYTTSGTYAIGSMGIYAGYTSATWNGSTAPHNFFNNLSVNRTGDASSWTYGDEKLWPGSGYLTFFAYAPHSDNPVYGTNKPTITATTGTPTLDYTIAQTHDKQVDLLVATPVKDQVKRDYVTIPLRHALTKIAFSARVANAPTADMQVRVTGIQLTGLYGSGSIPMDGKNRTWTTSGTSNHSYTVTNTPGEGLKTLPLTDVYQPLTPIDGHLFLLPQTLVEGKKGTGAAITVTYETQVGTATPEVKSFDLELSRAITAFNPGMAYNLMFTIDNGVTMIVAPTPWDKTDVEVDIKNRILNVSRIEASVYPGVPTRIFFWSNQPKDSVYVRTKGNIDNSRYPTGTDYTVNDAFQNLSGPHTTSPAYLPNIVYPGFDGVTTASGEGYIDVWHNLDATGNPVAGSPAIADGDKRHIWLNASGLARNVLLNSVIGSNPTTTPYVGTFHRWNETGERIVTWGAQYKWTAEVDYEPALKSILLDRQPSPFMATGQLYSDGNVGDPEAAQLHPDSTILIKGTGRVYFRVGWNTRLPSATTAPRYGRIKVVEYQANGTTPSRTSILYIRQGELDDFVYGEPRSLAVKWSPYNLTTTTLTGTTQSVQIYTDRSNAAFVKYPTQAGGLFHWANTTYPRYAYSPTVPANIAPSIWATPIITPGTYWAPLMSTHESCPPGYRRPKSGSITAAAETAASFSELSQSLYATPPDVNSSSIDNSAWGYYADGFFDRRKIEKAVGDNGQASSAVSPATAEVGYIGRVFYCSDAAATTKWKSLFFPAASDRLRAGKLESPGKTGVYLTSSLRYDGASARPIFFTYASGYALTWNDGDPYNTSSIRCVRDIGFTTELKPETEIVVPTALTYTASSSTINSAFVNEWVNIVAQALSGLPVGTNLRAKVTFTGTVTSTTGVVNTSALMGSDRIASGSTVTFDFTQVTTWNPGTRIQVAVENTGWEYKLFNDAAFTNGGSFVTGTINGSTTVANRGIILRKK